MNPSMIMSSYTERKDPYSSGLSAVSTGISFESTFSSISPTDSLFTPHDELADPFDMDAFSSSQDSTRSITPSDPIYSIDNNFMGMVDQNMLYSTPVKNISNIILDYNNTAYSNNMYSPMGSQDFMSTPPLQLDLGPSPFGSSTSLDSICTPSPSERRQYIIPSQTFIDGFGNSTPNAFSKSEFDSPQSSPLYNGPISMSCFQFMSPPSKLKQEYSPSSWRRSPVSSLNTVASTRGSPCPTLESSSILHRVQGTTSRIRKSSNNNNNNNNNKKMSNENIQVEHVEAGKFACDFPGCESTTKFYRMEHLKRHKEIHKKEFIDCEYCGKKFAKHRADNIRSHIERHAKRDKGRRTQFHPRAALEVELRQREKGRKLAPAADIGISTRRTTRRLGSMKIEG